MLDIKFVRDNAEQIRQAAKLKRIECDIDELLRIDQEKNDILFQIEQLRAERNKGSKESKYRNAILHGISVMQTS